MKEQKQNACECLAFRIRFCCKKILDFTRNRSRTDRREREVERESHKGEKSHEKTNAHTKTTTTNSRIHIISSFWVGFSHVAVIICECFWF